jgi:hypothetical protein
MQGGKNGEKRGGCGEKVKSSGEKVKNGCEKDLIHGNSWSLLLIRNI